MYRIVGLQRVHMYSDPDNFCAEVSMANLGNGELAGVFAQNRGLFHTDTGTLLLVRSCDNGRTMPQLVQRITPSLALAAVILTLIATRSVAAAPVEHQFDQAIDIRHSVRHNAYHHTRLCVFVKANLPAQDLR